MTPRERVKLKKAKFREARLKQKRENKINDKLIAENPYEEIERERSRYLWQDDGYNHPVIVGIKSDGNWGILGKAGNGDAQAPRG
jgi:hypothetical protein